MFSFRRLLLITWATLWPVIPVDGSYIALKACIFFFFLFVCVQICLAPNQIYDALPTDHDSPAGTVVLNVSLHVQEPTASSSLPKELDIHRFTRPLTREGTYFMADGKLEFLHR